MRGDDIIGAAIKTPQALNPALDRALAAVRVAEDNLGRDIVVLDMRQASPEFDYFVLVTGQTRRQLQAMAEEIDVLFRKEMGDRRLGLEGMDDGRWILLDFGDVMIHLFDPETRSYYDLDHLWGHATRVPLPEPAAAQASR